jgi:CRISPR/Cas system-associated exonuclease Cas4 (RecB family)
MVQRLYGKTKIFTWNDQKAKQQPKSLRGVVARGALTRLSHSKMTMFEKCPYAFKFYYVDGLTSLDDSDALINGKALHDMFYYASIAEYPEIIRTYEKYAEFMQDCEHFIEFSRKRMFYLGTSIPYLAEYEIYDKDLDVLLFIDRIDKLKDGYEVVDYKTGKVHGLGLYRFQLALYAYFVEKHLKIKVRRWGIYFTNSGRYLGEVVDRKKMELIPKTLEAVRNRIKQASSQNHFPKKSGPLCNFCNFRHYSLCDGIGENVNPNYFGELDVYRYSKKKKKDDDI